MTYYQEDLTIARCEKQILETKIKLELRRIDHKLKELALITSTDYSNLNVAYHNITERYAYLERLAKQVKEAENKCAAIEVSLGT